MASRQTRGFTVSGGDVDRTYPDGGGVALSAAITFASARPGSTMYVRHPDGKPYGRVEHDENGIRIYRDKEAGK